MVILWMGDTGGRRGTSHTFEAFVWPATGGDAPEESADLVPGDEGDPEKAQAVYEDSRGQEARQCASEVAGRYHRVRRVLAVTAPASCIGQRCILCAYIKYKVLNLTICGSSTCRVLAS